MVGRHTGRFGGGLLQRPGEAHRLHHQRQRAEGVDRQRHRRAFDEQCIEHAKASGMRQISLEVASDNMPAIKLYEKSGFVAGKANAPFVSMNLLFGKRGRSMNSKRDYNVEIKDTNDHKYAYGFDFDVMHPYMIKSFEPFFNKGSLLELGSFKGDFTRRFLPYFDDVTCVEASDVAIEEAKKETGRQGESSSIRSLRKRPCPSAMTTSC